MARLNKFLTDKSKEKDGVWVDADEGLRLKIRRSGNPDYNNFIRERSKGLGRALRHSAKGIEELSKVTKQGASKFVLVGWENLEDENGNAIPFSPEKALEIFELSQDFFEMVMEFANDRQNFSVEELKAASGNS